MSTTTNGNIARLALAAVLCTLEAVSCANFNVNIDTLVLKANLYYQRPLSLGPPTELHVENVEQLEAELKNDIKVIVHGFTGSRMHVSIRPLGNAYMATGTASVLLADWSDAAALDYHSSRLAVGMVARHFGKVLESFLTRLEIDHSAVHIIGHSLGAHIAGGIGQYFNGSLGRVTGLDPALPLFTIISADALRATAAQFVDVIHTDYPVFGDITPRGTVDFYPNFGHTPQPGCEDIDIVTANSCSHNRAVLLYAESIAIPKSFPAVACSLMEIKQRNPKMCLRVSNSRSSDGEADDVDNFENEFVFMGENVSRSASGTFYLETFDTTPFGMGRYSKL